MLKNWFLSINSLFHLMECLILEEIALEASAVEVAMTFDNRPKRKSHGEEKTNPLSDVVLMSSETWKL